MAAIIISSIVSAIATAIISIYAIKSHRLSNEIEKSNKDRAKDDENFKKELRDLYGAIVIANLVSETSTGVSKKLQYFKEHYNKIRQTNILDSIAGLKVEK